MKCTRCGKSLEDLDNLDAIQISTSDDWLEIWRLCKCGHEDVSESDGDLSLDRQGRET